MNTTTAPVSGPLYAQQRQRRILDALASAGRVSVADLAAAFDVTTETIRRDLDLLASRSLLVRVHGGAVARRTAVLEPDLATRSATNPEAKRRIADAARSLLPADPEASVLIDAGTTTAALVPHLVGRRGILVTHGLEIARAAVALPATSDRPDVHLLPGRLRSGTGAAVGSSTVDAIRALRPAVAFLGCNGMDEEGFTTPDPSEGAVKAAIVDRADLRVILADSSKIGTHHLVTFATCADVDAVVTDDALPHAIAHQFSDSGIEVIRA